MEHTTDRLVEITLDLDAMKEEGVFGFPDGPSFEDALQAAAPRAMAFEKIRSELSLGVPETVGAAWAEGVIIGYRLARADDR